MDKLNFNTSTNLYRPGDIKGLVKTAMRQKFKQKGWNFYASKDEIVVKLPREELLQLITESLTKAANANKIAGEYIISKSHFMNSSIEFSVAVESLGENNLVDNTDVCKIIVDMNYNEEYDYEEEAPGGEILMAYFEGVGVESIVRSFDKEFRAALKPKQEESKTSLVNWVFSSDSGAAERTFQIKKDWTIDRSFYPWIETDLLTYYKAFVASRSQIMVLYGPPGTGKTSFIRDFLCEMNINSYISYDLKILTSDSTFVNYVTGSTFDAIVIEDADDLLTSERGDSNKVIAKILNVSDGLIKLPRKKLIFSTNLTNVDEIDPAIIRPGRCFDVMEFRELTRDEAHAAAVTLGVTIETDKDKYSLAELFYLKDIQESSDPFTRKHGEQLKKRSVGFY